jgi:predicted 2-oxoglutarate/Fe(II)-dependent dioxygenase YbiX
MPDIGTALADLLASIQRPGGFHVAGTFDIHPPRLEVEGVGPIALPLLPVQAEQILRVAEQAPYGRRPETLVDPAVRRTWQVDAARVHISGRGWEADLAGVVERVRQGLAVAGEIRAELYKLLVYDTGGFFIAHRDTEKAPGMFATLVVVLPCDYSGGELLIRHKGQEARVELRGNDPAEAAFAAFYADCRHEVLPVASGHRLALIYNLVRTGGGPLPVPPDYDAEQASLAGLLRDWAGSGAGPDKLVYPLEHAYSEAEAAFPALKGKDAAVAAVLAAAAREADCDLHLALVSVAQSGWADYTGGGSWRNPQLEIGEVTETDWSVHDWRLPDGGRSEMGPLPFTEDELSPPDAFADLDETEPEFSEATGNEGASFERFYQRAALVLWPRIRRGQVLAAGGLGVSVPALLDLVRRWETAGARAGNDLWQEAGGLAAAIRAAWPEDAWVRRQASEAGRVVDLLAAQLRLGDVEGCAEFIARQTAAGAYGQADNAALALVLDQLPAGRAADLLSVVIAANVARLPGACAGLLARCAQAGGERRNALRAPALALLKGLPDGREAPPPTHWERPEPLTADQVADALSGLARIDGVLAGQAVARFLALPTHYDMDGLLLPAALALKGTVQGAEPQALTTLRQAVLAHLEARIALPLEPPADWTRAAEIACTCPNCRALARFLGSPTEPVWHFKAAEAERAHVGHSVKRHNCDLNLATDKRGRPYTLVCTKNQSSFDRSVRQRRSDLEHRDSLVC